MKEGKKKSTARKTSSSSASKRVVPKNQTPKMPAERSEPPKVKRIDVDEINKDFDDVETEDRRLIVFIAIAILVIVGTVIGLLVGCEKKENETKEPDKPGKTDVVVPEKPDEKGNKEDEDEGVFSSSCPFFSSLTSLDSSCTSLLFTSSSCAPAEDAPPNSFTV